MRFLGWLWPGLIVIAIVCLGATSYSQQKKAQVERLRVRFHVPAEATVTFVEETTDFPMGGGERIRFRLPNSRSPEDWLLSMARQRRIESFQVGRYRYDSRDDVNSVEYFPESDLYEAHYFWD